MCGIAGIVSFAGVVREPDLAAMNALLTHRGPDAGGEWVSPDHRAGLANRRLAILDLSPAGRQPMATADGALVIAYNGEIYNYVEVREELRALGHVFRTGTDTEVLLHAYRQWTAHCLEKLNGMFAFAIWDTERRQLFAARDRFGEKPFYYYHTGRTFAFASEIKSLLQLPEIPRRANARAVSRYIGLALVDGTAETFFESILQLPPAHYLTVDGDGQLAIRRYWALDPDRDATTLSDADRVERFRELFVDAVRLRLRSDVEVGSSLSGGLDSSSIVCTIEGLRNPDAPAQSTFSARHDIARVDEGRYIDAVVARTGARGHNIRLDGAELVEEIDQFIWHQDEPVAHTSQFAQWKVMQLAKQHGVTVMLDGQGADETIGGYPSPTFGYRFAELLRSGHWATLSRELLEFRHTQRALAPALRYLAAAMLPGGVRSAVRARYHGTSGLAVVDAAQAPSAASLRQALHHIMTVTSLPSLLRYADRNSMAFSRESRLPFLDHRLVEFVFTLGSEDLVAGGVTKRILRRAMRGTVPDVVLDRTDKIGFATPEQEWMTGPARTWLDSEIGHARRRGLLDPAAIDREWQRLLSGGGNSATVWRIVNLELWYRKFIDGR